MKTEHKEIIEHTFKSFSFLLDENLNYTFESFSNIIENHYKNEKIEYCCNILRQYKGIVSKNELIIDLK